ncbi:hypothetical protein V8C86DRAFT_2843121, partial [Haematococcus lacustris]
MRTAHKRAAEGETGNPTPSSDEEQQQHFSGKRIAVAAEVFDAVAQLDDGLRDKSKRSYVTQLKHYVRWCESQDPRCDDQDIVNSATLYYIYVVKLHGLIKRLRCKPHPTPAEEQELDQLETGPRSAHLKVSALKQLHAALQKEYKKACNRAKITEMPDLLRITVYNSAYKTLMKLVSGGDKISDLSRLDTSDTLLTAEDMHVMMSKSLPVKTTSAAVVR